MGQPAIRSREGRPTSHLEVGPEREPSVFISYATVDGTGHATRLDRELSRRGVHTWLSGRDIDEASDFTAQLERAIGRADRLVVCITRDVRREDSYVRREIAFAQAHDKPIAVARFAKVVPPISVVTNTYFEFYLDWDGPFERLLAFCRGRGAEPAGMTPAGGPAGR